MEKNRLTKQQVAIIPAFLTLTSILTGIVFAVIPLILSSPNVPHQRIIIAILLPTGFFALFASICYADGIALYSKGKTQRGQKLIRRGDWLALVSLFCLIIGILAYVYLIRFFLTFLIGLVTFVIGLSVRLWR